MAPGAQLIADALAAAGIEQVRQPGRPVGALPAVQIVPTDAAFDQAWIVYAYTVNVLVPRDDVTVQLAGIEDRTTAVVAALLAAGLDVQRPIRYVYDTAEDVPYIGMAVTVHTTRAGVLPC